MIFQSPAPTPWPSPIGPPPQALFERYFHDGVYKTWGNISPLYVLDTFDWVILIVYFAILGTLAIYGGYRIKQVIDFWRYRKFVPQPLARFSEDELPRITVQLPLFNELYVVDRLLKAVTAIDYPREKLEIQVLDDSTDETVKVAAEVVEKYAAEGFDITYIHRTDRTGFKAGALENGNKSAKGDLFAIFDADFVPKPDFLRKLVDYFTDPMVGCAQMRWSHINGKYNLLTRLQTIMLDGHFVVEQTTRNRTGGFFNFNGTAGIWRRQAIELSGGWQHDTLTEDTDLSFRCPPLDRGRARRAQLEWRSLVSRGESVQRRRLARQLAVGGAPGVRQDRMGAAAPHGRALGGRRRQRAQWQRAPGAGLSRSGLRKCLYQARHHREPLDAAEPHHAPRGERPAVALGERLLPRHRDQHVERRHQRRLARSVDLSARRGGAGGAGGGRVHRIPGERRQRGQHALPIMALPRQRAAPGRAGRTVQRADQHQRHLAAQRRSVRAAHPPRRARPRQQPVHGGRRRRSEPARLRPIDRARLSQSGSQRDRRGCVRRR